MGEQNFPDNVLYELDNLDVLRGMNDETVDLIATDPPFNTQRNRAGTAGFYVDNWKWGDTGRLPDQWAWNEVHPVWLEEIKDDNPALFEVIEAAGACHGDGIAAFLCFLSVRLLEMRRVLKPTGSIYLHCDHTANAYIRMAMDAVFGPKRFLNEIAWLRKDGEKHNLASKRFPQAHDTIYYYSKSGRHTHKPTVTPYDEEYIAKHYKYTDSQGRYATFPCTNDAGGNRPYEFRGITRAWRFEKARMEEMFKKGLLTQATPSSPFRYKKYLTSAEGVKAPDIWTDTAIFAPNEKTDSPDQKPLALYERMILASSNPGDLVLDPFAGCATTIIAARKHGRRWVGVDRRKDARFHVVMRMMGITAKNAENLRRERPDLEEWLDGQLAAYDAHYRTEAPQRTDGGASAAPSLGPVFHPIRTERPKWQRLRHDEMRRILTVVQSAGDGQLVVCAGCGRAIEWQFMELDHRDPKKDGGENYITNRVLLCGPCNGKKRHNLTLSGLRNANKADGWIKDEPRAQSADVTVRERTSRIRDAWDAPDVQTLLHSALL